MERQSDFLLSTLREYVGALGGQLELRVVFPDGEFVIETLAQRRRGVRPGFGRRIWRLQPRCDDGAIGNPCSNYGRAF
jgi:hypothetical protein